MGGILGKTKVVGIAGRFKARYGASIRKKWKEVMERRYDKYLCPYCGNVTKMYRMAFGIWKCPKCNSIWAGAAYTPWTIEK